MGKHTYTDGTKYGNIHAPYTEEYGSKNNMTENIGATQSVVENDGIRIRTEIKNKTHTSVYNKKSIIFRRLQSRIPMHMHGKCNRHIQVWREKSSKEIEK